MEATDRPQQKHTMKSLIQSRSGGTALVLIAFACWIGALALIPRSSDWYFVATYSIAGFAFFLAACFLPVYRDKRYILGRRSVLQLMATFFGLAGMSSINTGLVQEMRHSSHWLTSAVCLASFVIPFGIYHLATCLIRGMHAPEQYAVEKLNTGPSSPTRASLLRPE